MPEYNTEELLLGAWIFGEHTEDINLFGEDDFEKPNNQVLKALKSGKKDILDISKASRVPVRDIVGKYTQAFSNYSIAYETCIHEKVTQSQKRLLQLSVIDGDLTGAIDRLNSLRDWENERKNPRPKEKNYADILIDELERRSSTPIIKWGVSVMDKYMASIMPGELTTIAARPSVGKSTIMLQMARHVAKQKQKILFYPLEMSKFAIIQRIVMNETGVSGEHIKTGRLTDEEIDLILSKREMLSDLYKSGNFVIMENRNNIEDIQKDIKDYKPFAVFIDQLTQLDSENQRFKDPRMRFTHMTRTLKRTALDNHMAVILACQINRSAQERVPTLADLKESGSIEEDSDNVILIHRYSEKEAQEKGFRTDDSLTPLRFEIAKQREGAIGAQDMYSIGGKFVFRDIETHMAYPEEEVKQNDSSIFTKVKDAIPF